MPANWLIFSFFAEVRQNYAIAHIFLQSRILPKGHPAPKLRLVKFTVIEHQVSVHKGFLNAAFKSMSFKRTPATFIQDIFFSDSKWFIQVDKHQISIVAFPYVAALFDAEKVCNVMAHF